MDFFSKLKKIEESLFVIDNKVYELYMDCFANIPQDKMLLITTTEENKVIDTVLDICEKITELKAKRNATLVFVGGGIVQDITGFVANITYRGDTLGICSDNFACSLW